MVRIGRAPGGRAEVAGDRGSGRWGGVVATILAVAAMGPLGPSARAVQPGVMEPFTEAPDPADVTTRLLVAKGAKPGAPPIVALRRAVAPATWEAQKTSRQRLLEREIVRQAVLIAARDELGLATRDELLDDAPPPAGGVDKLEIVSTLRPYRGRILVRRAGGPKPEALILKELPPGPDAYDYPLSVAEIAGPLSRKEFVEALKKSGLSGKPNAFRPKAALPADVERALEGLDFIEVYAAVRALHGAIRADGESPERLGALARGYALLASLTCDQWGAAHRGFGARALLYAERLSARDPSSPWALWNRAFVLGLAGIDRAASDDLVKAEGRREEKPAAVPEWAAAIDASTHYDLTRLRAVKGPSAKLAALLAMQAAEHPRSSHGSIAGALALLEAAPECDRAYDALALTGRINQRHVTTVAGPEAFGERLPARLKEIKGLPRTVLAAIDAGRDEPEILDELAKAGAPGVDAGEPSWAVLARMASDARFLYTLRRLTFMAQQWGVPVDEYWAEVRGLVAKHRHLPFLLSIADPGPGAAALGQFADRFDWSDLEVTQQPLIEKLRQLRHPFAESLWPIAAWHGSVSSRDLCLLLEAGISPRDYARQLATVSPHSPYGAGSLIAHDGEMVAGRLDGWRKEFADAPAFLGPYCDRLIAEQRYDEAIPMLESYIKLSPDQGAYRNLAFCRWKKGDEEGWKATLDRYLEETESLGLEHSQVQIDVARWLVGKGRGAEAKPYAEAAAETWSWAGMQCAADVDEGLEDWEGAEFWCRRISERYIDTSWDTWYRFCKRTGRGDLREATALAAGQVEGPRQAFQDPTRVPHNEASSGYFLWSLGKPREAIARFEASDAAGPAEYPTVPIILLSDEIGDVARRDAAIQRLLARSETTPATIGLCRAFQAALVKDAPASDAKAWDALIESAPEQYRGDYAWYVSRFLKNRGRAEDSRRYLERTATTKPTILWIIEMAASDRREAAGAKPR